MSSTGWHTCMVIKNICIPYMQKNQPYNTSLANHTIHVFVTPVKLTFLLFIYFFCVDFSVFGFGKKEQKGKFRNFLI
jgi:hypothetical protein